LRKSDSSAALEMFDKVLLLSPDHAEAYFRSGQAYILQKNIEKGIDYLVKSTRLSPQEMTYSLYLSRVYERTGKLIEAKNEYQRIIESGTKDPRLKEAEKLLALTSGRLLVKNGEPNAALLIFNGLLLEHPDDPAVLFYIGNTYITLNRAEEAERIFAKLYFQNPKNPTVNMRLATIYNATKRPRRAQKHLKMIMDLGVNNQLTKTATVQYYVIEGRIHLAAKDWKGALAALHKVIALNPRRTEAYFNIAMANLQLGRLEQAEEAFLKVLKINPNDFSTRLNLGQYYIDTGKIEKAKAQYQYIIDNDKTNRWGKQARIRMNVIYTAVADKALESGKIAESLLEYEKALDYYSANTKASFTRGLIFIQQKKYAEARKEFESVVRHRPNNVRARINLANVYEQLNILSKAAEQYEMIMQIDKDSREGKFARSKWKITKARALWSEKKLAEAETLFKEITQEQPDHFQAFAFLGVLQASRGKLREAASSYHRVLELRPTNYAVKMLLGKAFERLGMDSLAANEYRGIIFAGGKVPQIPEAKRRLAAVESRLSGFSNTLSYQFVYDSNLNLDDENPIEEIRSDLALSFIYALKTRDDLSFRISWSPTYSSYHIGQNDFLRSVLRSNIILGAPDNNWNASVSRQDQNSLVNDTRLSEATSVSLGRGMKIFTYPLPGMTPIGYEGEKIATSINVNSSLRYIQSFSASPIESMTGSLSVSMSQALRWGISATLSYALTVRRNINQEIRTTQTNVPVTDAGGLETVNTRVITYDPKDYEYNSHALNINISRGLAPGLRGSFLFSGNFSGYTNVDSGAFARGENSKRTNLSLNFSPSLSYEFFKNLRFVLSGTLQKNFSSLPVGLSTRRLNEEDVIASFQSTSLGKYTRYSVEGGFVMNF
ncbi:MAG TPA: tetratricopeptide repeat protein, partial [Gammaproteobacteria bacterium]|nr:tetratricopeptide repeat protein [Gammaproteobacteria bacterium]